MNLANAKVGQLLIPVDDFENGVAFRGEPHLVHHTHNSELWLAEFTDPDGNQLALMSEVPINAQ